MFQLFFCDNYLGREELGRLQRKYFTRDTEPWYHFIVRVYTIGRLDELSDVDSKERHLTIIKEMLLDGKYKKLAYG